jgi:hypothetical protein
MARRLVSTLIGLTVLAACSAEVAADDPTSTTATTVTTTATTAVTGERPPGAVLVKATGILASRSDGTLEICPGQGEECAGIRLTGDIASPDTDPPVIQATGWYDGAEISVATSETPHSSLFTETDFSTPCEGLRGAGSVNPPNDPVNSIAAYTETIPDRFAGMWWDRANAVMTVWLTGSDLEEHRLAIEKAAGSNLTVCVTGDADFSETELLAIQQAIHDIIDLQATAMWGTSADILTNRVEVMMEYLDTPTRKAVSEQFGDAVVFHAFLEILEGTIADLPEPVPARPGDVELLTQPNRAGGGMEALGTFEVAFDEERRCVYFPGDEFSADGSSRILPVWPFGYTAGSNPLRIYDQAGELVAEEGDTIQMGGGFVEYVTEKELCGAGGAWIMSSPPVLVES